MIPVCTPDGALDSTLLVARSYLAGTGGKVVVGAQFDKPRMEMDGVAVAFEHGAAKVIVE